jgi:hypothetical protein
MQNFKTLRQSLLGELVMSPERREREREKNAIYSGHLHLCQQPRAAHALRSDQHLLYFYILCFGAQKQQLIGAVWCKPYFLLLYSLYSISNLFCNILKWNLLCVQFYLLFSCDSSSICDNVGRSVGQSDCVNEF